MDSRDRNKAARSLAVLADDVSECAQCPRLVEWREQIGREKRAAYRDDDYWARGVPGFGDPAAHLLVVGLAPPPMVRTAYVFTGDRSGLVLLALYRWLCQPIRVGGVDDGLVLDGAWVTSPVKCAPQKQADHHHRQLSTILPT